MIFKHTCLDGRDRTGQELDCPVCRSLLLEAFRAPVRTPRAPCCTPDLPCQKHWTGPVPPVSPDPPGHTVSTALDTGLPEGVWAACCSCGWMQTGTFPSASPEAVLNARHLMQMHARTHTDNPLKGTEDQ